MTTIWWQHQGMQSYNKQLSPPPQLDFHGCVYVANALHATPWLRLATTGNVSVPVPIMVTHGLMDTHVNPLGCCAATKRCCKISQSSAGNCVSVLEFFEDWATKNGCDPERPTRLPGQEPRSASSLLASPDISASVSCVQREGCKAPTILCIHNHGKHTVLVLMANSKALEVAGAGVESATAMLASFALQQRRAL